jgi:hypothetical protein
MFTIIALPNDFVSDIGSNATDVISTLSPFATMVIGVLLAVLVVTVLINTLKHH